MQQPEVVNRPPVATPEEPSREGRGGFRFWGWLIALAVVGGLVFVKMKYFPSPDAGAKGGPGGGKGGPGAAGAGGKGGAGGGAPRVPVKVYVVAGSPLANQVVTTGSVMADEAVAIRSEIAGKITSLNIREGQPVRKGQLLFSINAEETQAALRKQEYNIKLYRDQEKRQRTLLEREFISAQEYEQTNNQLLTAQAELASLRAQLDKAYVRAPFDGVLGLTTATVGTYVSPGVQITTLSRIRPVKIDFAVPGRYASAVHVGDKVVVTEEGTNRQYDAEVYAVNPQIDPGSRTLQVRARYANSKEELRPGAFVKVNLQLGETEQAIQVPTEAVVPVASGYQVYQVKGGKVVPRPVKIGIRSSKVIQITEGLAMGDTVIRSGILQVKPGDAVVINN